MNMKTFKNPLIRKLTQQDVKAYFHLRLQGLQEAPTSFSSSYEEEKTAGCVFFEKLLEKENIDNLIFGAFIDDELIGAVGLVKEKHAKTKHKCILWGMYVHPDFRNKGIGKALMEKAIAHTKHEMKCLMINLSAETTNLSAKKLYESCGFRIWGTEPKALQVNGKFYEEFHMSLLLDS